MPFARYTPLAPVGLLEQERGITHSPTVDGRVVHRDAALVHHLLEIAETEAISEVPPDAEQDH
jgi:hypothetical protein